MATDTNAMALDMAAVEAFKAQLRGSLIQPGDDSYEAARALYNAMIDKHPRLIVQSVDVADVISAVNFAREQRLALAVRGGGHNGPGLGSCDDGLVIDLSRMKGIHVDPKARTVRVEGGCTWGDVDHATHAFGLATPSGFISTTGVGGLTLGGGIGYLSRACGLSLDNLLSADIVLADGSYVTASESEHPDLFWAIRGGGGNFGVVTSFVFRLHEISTVYGGPIFWPLDQAKDVLKFWSNYVQDAPRDINGWFGYVTVPPAPLFPEQYHMEKMCAIVWCYTGPIEQANAILEPLRRFRKPALELFGPMPFPMLQGMFDGLYPAGLQWYWKADFFKELSDEAISRHVEHGAKMPTMHSSMHLYPVNGAAHRVGPTETPWSYRDAVWSQVIVGVDPDPAKKDVITQWAKAYYDALHPYGAGGAYVNFMMEEGEDRIRATYRGNYDRLAEVKAKYDPENFFRVNQNIRPAKARAQGL